VTVNMVLLMLLYQSWHPFHSNFMKMYESLIFIQFTGNICGSNLPVILYHCFHFHNGCISGWSPGSFWTPWTPCLAIFKCFNLLTHIPLCYVAVTILSWHLSVHLKSYNRPLLFFCAHRQGTHHLDVWPTSAINGAW